MKVATIVGLSAILISMTMCISACNNMKSEENTGKKEIPLTTNSPIESTIVSVEDVGDKSENELLNTGVINQKKPNELVTIPQDYYEASQQQGTLVELIYNTFESRTYAQKTKSLTKRAIVYLPYGYSSEKQYNVFYLMHGGWGNEITTLGTAEQPNAFKNVVDHAIENGEIDPIIIVCPSYNNESSQDSADYTLAFYTLTVNYHNELVNDLIPAVEGTYSTYAEGVNPEDIKKSREHRAFGGFSMGSVATWYTFVNCLDEFYYFIPMSGAMDYEGDDVDAAVTASGHEADEFFIYALTGSEDFEYSHFTSQMEGMFSMKSENFISIDENENGNIAFRVKEGYAHDGIAAMEYTYNGLLYFWK